MDATWENVEPSLWSLGELCSGMTCSCLPCLRPLASRWLPGLSSRYGKGYYGQRPGSHAYQSEGLTEIEHRKKRAPPASPAESDSDMIYGLEDYKSHVSASEAATAILAHTEPVKVQSSHHDGPSWIPQPPRPIRAGPSQEWIQSGVATRVGTNRAQDMTRDRARRFSSGIQVRHDIMVRTSPPPESNSREV